MIVVSDTSPFVKLAHLQLFDVLPALFGAVLIPPEVHAELCLANKPDAVRRLATQPPEWLIVRPARSHLNHPDLHDGEAAAIALAEELSADVLLIDERLGHQFARSRGLRTLRTAAMIKLAADAGLIHDLRATFERLAQTDFRVPKRVLDELLRDHLHRRIAP